MLDDLALKYDVFINITNLYTFGINEYNDNTNKGKNNFKKIIWINENELYQIKDILNYEIIDVHNLYYNLLRKYS